MTTTLPADTARRTLHIVDADNLTGGPTEYQCVADEAASRYRVAAGVRVGDLVVVGSDLRSAAVTAFSWPTATLRCTTGTDAVDHLLLADLTPSFVEARFERVVLGSGDGIFAGRMARLRAAGLQVEVVAAAGSVSWRLYPVTHRVTTVEAVWSCAEDSCRLPVGRGSLQLAA